MSQLLGQLEQARKAENAGEAVLRQEAILQMVTLAVADATGETTKDDVRMLQDILSDWEIPAETYADIVEAIPKIAYIVAQMDECKVLVGRTSESRQKLTELRKRHEQEMRAAIREYRTNEGAHSRISNLVSSRRELALRVPMMFEAGHDPYDAVPLSVVRDAVDRINAADQAKQAEAERLRIQQEQAALAEVAPEQAATNESSLPPKQEPKKALNIRKNQLPSVN